MATTGPILFFDGICGLCDKSVSYFFEKDRRHALRFAPLQGELAKKLLDDRQRLTLDSMVLVEKAVSYERSTAVLRAMRLIGGSTGFVGSLGLAVPRPVRDFIYKRVAKNRYAIFGQTATCRLPSPAERAYFLD